jgi:putative peptidoglycan lipid II flippase
MMATFIASRILGWLRLSVIGAKFDLSSELDAFWAAFLIPDVIFNLVVAGALASAFIPVFTGYLAKQDEREAWRVASTVMNALMLILIGLSILLALAAPLLIPVFAAGYARNPGQLELAVNLTRIMMLSPIFMGLSSLVTGILNSYRQFLSGSVAPLVYNATIILFAIFAEPFAGIYALAYGVVAGALLMWLTQIPELTFRRTQYAFVLDLRHPGVLEVAGLAGPRVIGFLLVFVINAVDTNLASRLAEGSLSALRYAFQLMLLPLGVFSMAVSAAIFPSLSHYASLGQQVQLRAALARAIRIILFLTLPSAVAMIVLRRPIVHLLFQYGRFGPEAREDTAAAFLFYAVGLAGHALVQILTRAFYAARDTRTPLVTTFVSTVANVGLAILLVSVVVEDGPFGIRGLALANSIATIAEAVLLLALLQPRLRLPLLGISFATMKQLAAALLMGIAIFVYVRVTNATVNLEESKIGLALQLLSALLVAGLSYLAACAILRVRELELLLEALRGRVRR